MEAIGTAAGWTLYEQDDRYYVRAEQVVSFLSNSSEARSVLAAILAADRERYEGDAA